jgi:putative nucleotidyltransferase with HDIG domain
MFPIPPVIQRFAKKFSDRGFSLYIVGGAVRDHLLGIPCEDYDFTTDALPDQVISLFHHVIPTGIEHGTVTVHYEKQLFEVTTFRSEGDYLDGRHPSSVTYVRNLAEDLKRRDFTINAFAVDCSNGHIIDINNGIDDLKKRVIRAIGEPQQRFAEDALRMLRACRIAAKLDFTIEEQTLIAIGNQKHTLEKVSAERIREELFRLVGSDHPGKGMHYLRTTGILGIILPELAKGEGVWQGGMHHEDVLSHNITTLIASATLTDVLEVRLAALLHDIGKSEVVEQGEDRNTFYRHEIVGEKLTKTIMKRLKASNEQTKTVCHLVRHHMFDYQSSWSDSAVRRFITRIEVAYIPLLFSLRMADQIALSGKIDTQVLGELKDRIERILAANDALSIKDLAVHGDDLMAIGIPKGKRIGDTLSFLFETVLDDPKQNTREQLLLLAKNYQEFAGFTN